MKQMITAVFSVLAISFSASAQHDHGDHSSAVPNLTAAELSAHKIDKLVQLKQVDAAFVKNLRGLEVVNLEGGGAGKPTFKVFASQEVDDGNAAIKLELTLDEKGKVLGKPQLVEGVAAAKPAVWAPKDPVTLIEEALHHVEHLSGDKKIAQFIAPLKAIRILQVKQDAKTLAQVEIVANGIAQKLVMTLSLSGELLKTEVKE